MHEASLMEDLMFKIEQYAEQNNARKVVGVKVKLGAKSHMSASHFTEHFRQSSAGTIAEGAELDIVELTDANDPDAAQVVLDAMDLECD